MVTSDKWTSKGALINQLFFTSLGNQMLIREVPRASSWQLQQRGDREGILAPHWPPCSFPNSSNFYKSSRNRSHREAFPRTEERLSDQSDQAGRAEQNRTSRIRYSLAPAGSVILYPQDSSLHPGLRKGGILHHLPQRQSTNGAGPAPAGVLGSRAWLRPQPLI